MSFSSALTRKISDQSDVLELELMGMIGKLAKP
jgi:hypothetical protein